MSEAEKSRAEEEKEASAFLRERFLYLISSVCGTNKHCKITMYENTNVTGDIKAMDYVFENIIIRNLKTPSPDPLKVAVLRTCDVLSFSYSRGMK